MSTQQYTGPLAEARRIGEDVEVLVARRLDGLALVPDDVSEWYDAVTTSLLEPTDAVPFGIPLVERGTKVEIKAARSETSNGDGTTPGRWYFRGRDDDRERPVDGDEVGRDGDGQHARLLDASGMYVLAVYRDADPAREVAASILVPASVVDEHLRGRWYASGRHGQQVAKLAWPALLDPAEV